MSVLIHDAFIITQNENHSTFHGDIYIENDVIVELKPSRINVEAEYCIDASDNLVLPGFINMHTHAPMVLFRGYGDDRALEDWLHHCIWPVEKRLTPEAIEIASRLAFLEMIASGTTTCVDMYTFEEVIAEVADAMGIRAFLGYSIRDDPGLQKPLPGIINTCTHFLKKWKNHSLISPCVAPHSTYTCGPETLQKARDIAESNQTLLMTHCSETRKEIYMVERSYNCRPVTQLERFGLLSNHMLLVHCGWITKTEIQQIKKADARVVHCPVSNMKIATGGVMPLPELLQAQVFVGLGTDGAASNNSLDLCETMKFCALVQKQHRWDPQIIPAQTVLDMATITAAKSIHANDLIGSIEEGKKADIILVDIKKPHLTPMHDPVSNVVYAMKGSDVDTTIINGVPIYLHKIFPQMAVDDILKDATLKAKTLTTPV